MSVKQVLSDALGGVQGNAQPRGLHNFIQEIRHCSNAAEEQVGAQERDCEVVGSSNSACLCVVLALRAGAKRFSRLDPVLALWDGPDPVENTVHFSSATYQQRKSLFVARSCIRVPCL